MEEKAKIRISVRNLVEFILRGGDIDNRRSQSQGKDAMQEGSRLHRKIQRAQGAEYQAEVSLKYEIEGETYDLVLEGRADGIITGENGITVDEIKGVYLDPLLLEEAFEVHQAQAKCYAYIYAKQKELEEIYVQMTYCNIDTEVIRRFSVKLNIAELEEWFMGIILQYKKWAEFQFQWRSIRQKSIHQLEFPFPYRKGQDKLVKDVYLSIIRKKNLFIQAPTGVGKTISTVFPAVRAVGEGYGEKIFYLTAKTITRTVAQEAFFLLEEQGYQSKIITLTAKEKLCPMEEMKCNPQDCPYAKGHYDRVNDAVFGLITRAEHFTREIIEEQAKNHRVCPFEMGLDVSLWSDVIICDYNYVFDPNVYLKRFFQDGIRGDYIFLVDEAHNLVERGRKMYSAVLYKESFLVMKKIAEPYSRKLAKQFETCNRQMLEFKRECDTYTEYENIGHFTLSLMQLGAMMDEFAMEHAEFEGKEIWGEFYLELRHFMNMYDILDENYTIYTEHEEDGRFKLKLLCVNTAKVLQERLNKANSTVFFSATLLPIQYYKSMLSTDPDNYAVYADTAFTREQNLLLIGNDVSSKYTRRNENEFRNMAGYIRKAVQVKKGNYLVFFPSYSLMNEIYSLFEEENKERIPSIVQGRNMTEEEREEFLNAFLTDSESGLVGFCVMGGIFGEGIDLKGERLIGAIIIGTGLPQISSERDLLKNYYDRKCSQGFDYAYLYPGMNKVMQAAGRVIRTAEDIGVVLLLDERFLRSDYRELFPREWENYQSCNLNNVEEKLENFWK